MGYGAYLGGWWMVLPVAVVIVGVIRLIGFGIRRATHTSPADESESDDGTPQGSALDVLKKLYARGELTHWEFERMKRDLRD